MFNVKVDSPVEHRYFVEYIDHWNENKQTYIYLFGSNPDQIINQMSADKILSIDQTD